MAPHKMPDPPGARAQRARRAFPNHIQVPGEFAPRLDADVHAVQVGFHERDEAREPPLFGPPVDDFVDAHEGVFVLDGAGGGRRAGNVIPGGGGAGVGAGGGAGRSAVARGEGVFAEMEFLGEDGVAGVCARHVFRREWDGDVEVQIVAQDGAGDEDDEDGEGGVFEIRDLDLHRTEFHTPAGVLVVWGWLEAHVLPVGGL